MKNMAEELIEIQIGEEKRLIPYGTPYTELAKEYQHLYEDDIVLVSMENRLRELKKKVHRPGKLEFLTTRSNAGRKSYRRSLVFLMEKAVHSLVGKNDTTARVKYSLDNGLYCVLTDGSKPDADFLEKLRKEMARLVEADIPFEKVSTNTQDAVHYFEECKMQDKVGLFQYRRSSRVNIYSLNHFRDYYYGYMVPSTGYLKYYDLQLFEDGFMLLYPDRQGKELNEFAPSMKLFHTLEETDRWNATMGIETIGQLNDAIVSGRIQDVILTQEAIMEKKIGALAEMIAQDRSKKFVMIAGPSSSGKTTFSHRLSIQLRAQGLVPHPFPLDDYYVDHGKTPLDEDGNPDYECLEALDVERFNEDLQKLLSGERVEIPIYNFKTGRRENHGKWMQLGPEDVLVIEGIHGLNDRLSYSIDAKYKFKIYISALTALSIDEHNYLPTTDGRLLRRIVRDARTRGSSAQETIAMWDSVRRGESQNIFPFQESADVMFNSALLYEFAVLKAYAEPVLFAVPKDAPEYQEAKRLLKFLDYFLSVPSEEISSTSLIREFIGGGCFHL